MKCYDNISIQQSLQHNKNKDLQKYNCYISLSRLLQNDHSFCCCQLTGNNKQPNNIIYIRELFKKSVLNHSRNLTQDLPYLHNEVSVFWILHIQVTFL